VVFTAELAAGAAAAFGAGAAAAAATAGFCSAARRCARFMPAVSGLGDGAARLAYDGAMTPFPLIPFSFIWRIPMETENDSAK
jgi:hypothetical protein